MPATTSSGSSSVRFPAKDQSGGRSRPHRPGARTFRFFWDTANPKNGLIPDRFPTPSYSSIAAVGFGLTAYPVGVERGYVTRKEARKRVLTTLRFLRNAPQGHAVKGMTGHKGFFYHFLDMKTGQRYEDSELSTVDTAILLAGALFCQSYFDGSNPEEVEIRRLVDEIYARVDWPWAAGAAARDQSRLVARRRLPRVRLARLQRGHDGLSARARLADAPRSARSLGRVDEHVRHDELANGFRAGVPELRAALRSPIHPRMVRLPRAPGRLHAPARPRLFREHPSRRLCAAGVCDRQPAPVQGLWRHVWGLTASDGPGGRRRSSDGTAARLFRTYAARGAGSMAATTTARWRPTAVVGSLPFAPESGDPAVLDMHKRFGAAHLRAVRLPRRLQPQASTPTSRCATAASIPGFGWVAGDYLGIDQGADPRDDRELPQRDDLGRDAQEPVPAAAASASVRVHGRLARGIAE